jgi:hypothetical protein
MRPISTHIKLLVAGASRSGKAAFIEAFADGLGAQPANGTAGHEAPASHKAKNTTTPIFGGRSSNTKDGSEGVLPSVPAVGPGLLAAGGVSDPVTAIQFDPSSWATRLQPLLVPEAGRELVYTLQVSGINSLKSMQCQSYLLLGLPAVDIQVIT